jgi:homoaconitase/3-isopropylmalate dehydratase large subunit
MSPRRIPTKAELLRLQKLYRTDKRIAEVLGNGVTEHLVAYWRRKKGVPKYSFPKFSENEIREVWDRFGDDFHAGMELGISKAAFYNWRRRYKITKRPEALKLEQLTLELHTRDKKHPRMSGTGRQTITQKILSRRSGVEKTEPGEVLEVEPDMVVVPGDAGRVLDLFGKTGMTYVRNPNRIVIPLDGGPPTNGRDLAATHKAIRDFVRRQQIKNFFDIGEGNPQQVVIEKGLLLPGQLSLGSDQGAATLGCMGALAFSIGPEEMSNVWASGKAELPVPETIRVNVSGKPPRGVFARDVIHNIIGHLKTTGAEGMVIEYYGTGIDQMSLSERITLCHMSSATGARAAICPYDSTTRRYVNPRARKPFTPVMADRNATYSSEYSFEINTMKPMASGPEIIETVAPVDELGGLPIRQVFIGGIANGRFDDLKIVADILKGKRVNPEVRFILQPASRAIYLEALKKGLMRVFVEAGGIIVNPGSPLAGRNMPLLADEENGLTTYFDTSFDIGDGQLYQVSPATAAASALTGRITNPTPYVRM